MGFLKRIHKAQKSAEENKRQEFIKKVEELSNEYGLSIVPMLGLQKRAETKEVNEDDIPIDPANIKRP